MSDKEQIENCIDVYYAGCCESDSGKIKEAFDKLEALYKEEIFLKREKPFIQNKRI